MNENFIDISDNRIQHFKNQKFAQLKSECLKQRKLFEDPLFRPTDSNIYYSKRLPKGLKWLRPHQICKTDAKPKFIVDTANANDLDQGFLGNCWFVAGTTAITYLPELFRKVVPQHQEFDQNYAGIFHFRFWLYGRWTDVVIDDYLPAWEDNRLAFCSNRQEPNEFWAALLEKAYAKCCGSYENLEGGFTTDILIDLTGGIEENFDLKNKKANLKERDQLWSVLSKARGLNSMNGCYIEPDPNIFEAKLANGLVKGHAYTVTNIADLNVGGRATRLIRLRNPWANEFEWKGAWSDSSREFLTASDEIKRKLDYRKESEGEFWMTFDDFYANFDLIQFCHLTPDSLSEEVLKSYRNKNISWSMASYHGEWASGFTAGGSGNMNDQRYWTNPQYLIRLVDVDLDDNENLATIIIALMQKNTRENRAKKSGMLAEEFIQFRLFRVNNEQVALEAKQKNLKLTQQHLERVGNSGDYVNKREVTRRFRVEPGYYVIIPSTYDANVDGSFLLRIFTEKMINNRQLLQNNQVNESTRSRALQSNRILINSNSNRDANVRTWISSMAMMPSTSRFDDNDNDNDARKVNFTSLATSSPSTTATNDNNLLENFKKVDLSNYVIQHLSLVKRKFFGFFK